MYKYLLLIPAFFCSLLTFSQTPVRYEPRHHNVFENEFVRILDVHIGPHDTTLFHLHNTPSVFIVFTKTNVGSQLAGKQPEKGINLAGTINYDSLVTPRLHRVWNEDSTWFHVMDIELTSLKPKKNPAIVENSSARLLFNRPEVNGYQVRLDRKSNLELPACENGYLLISLGESEVNYTTNNSTQRRLMKAGHYIWIEAGKVSSLKIINETSAAFGLLQLK